MLTFLPGLPTSRFRRLPRLFALFATAAASGFSADLPAASPPTALYRFQPPDGDNPTAPLLQAGDGAFYGTIHGGASGYGKIFRFVPGGPLTTLHEFTAAEGSGGDFPLIEGADGNLYGLGASDTPDAIDSSPNGAGTIYRLTTAGVLTVLHTFSGPDGAFPSSLFPGRDGAFYGVTAGGSAVAPGGSVFRIAPDGTLTTLHTFAQADGKPGALIQARDGNLYGLLPAKYRESGHDPASGRLYRLTPAGVLTILHRFDSASDGSYPAALVEARDGSFYGTTTDDGPKGYGTIYRFDLPDRLTAVHVFGLGDIAQNYATLLAGSDGNFYGTTSDGFFHTIDRGIAEQYVDSIYQLTPGGALTTLYRSSRGGVSSITSFGGLTQASDGSLYATIPGDEPDTADGNTGTILRVDAAIPTLSLRATDFMGIQPGSGGTKYTITRAGADLSQALTVRFALRGPASDGVTARTRDGQPADGQAVIPAGRRRARLVLDSAAGASGKLTIKLLPDPAGAYLLSETRRVSLEIFSPD